MRALVLLWLLGVACAHPEKTSPETGGSVAKSPPIPSARIAPKSWPAALAPTDSAPPSTPSAASLANPPSTTREQAPSQLANPEKRIQTAVEGCLAASNESHRATRSFFRPPPEKVELSVEGSAVRVTHHLNHACCLRAGARVETTGRTVTLVEELSGTPCRCRCSSVIRSRVPLPPGEHELRVQVAQDADTREAHRQTITVPAE